MHRKNVPFICLAAIVAVLTASTAMSQPLAAGPQEEASAVASDHLAGTFLTVSPEIGFARATLRVTGPGGYEAIAWSEGGPLTLDLLSDGWIAASDGMPGGVPQILRDGRYGYEVVFWLEDGSRRVHEGGFRVEGGTVAPRTDGGGEIEDVRSIASPTGEGGMTNVSAEGSRVDDYFWIDGSSDYLNAQLGLFLGSLPLTDGQQFYVENHAGKLRIRHYTTPLVTVDPFTETWGRLGIGTTVPQADLHIYSPGGNIRITDSDACPNPNAAWEIEEDFGRLMFEVVPNCPHDLDGGKMWIHGDGKVGIGTRDPADSLHISLPYPAIRLTDSDPCPLTAASWQIDQALESLRFRVVNKCSGDPSGTKMVIHGSGNVGIGTASPAAKLHVIGNGIIEGDVAFGSSRTIKHGIEPVDTSDVLASIRDLPLYRWKYKDDPVQASHVGPMAEDVHAAFRLGRDEKHLSPADSAGLALAAIQGVDERLDREVDGLRAVVELLVVENRELRERLEAVEAR